MAEYPNKVISCSESRTEHESKKAWLKTQGINFGDYDLQKCNLASINSYKYWRGLNFYWCFKDPETATAFRLRWLKDE
jgi:hypothetical protein